MAKSGFYLQPKYDALKTCKINGCTSSKVTGLMMNVMCRKCFFMYLVGEVDLEQQLDKEVSR